MKFYILATILLLSFISSAQANVLERKGKWSFYYGYNRSSYSNSDYHLTGNNYDFTLKNLTARDGQSEIAPELFLPWNLSVPQNNTRFSYFIADNFSVSFGSDHMKYIMNTNQTVGINGTINAGTTYDGTYSGTDTITVDSGLLLFEHTDGLNFVSVELEHFIDLWSNAKKTQALSLFWGPGLAIMIPKTNATLFGGQRHDKFKIAGNGYSLKLGFEYNFSEKYFTRFVVKHGHINMSDVRTTSSSSDKLSHKFDFKETFIVFGVYF
jgi:hypothetical protein